MWTGGSQYDRPTTRRFRRKEWPTLTRSVRYGDDKRKTLYISAAREVYRMETGYEVDPYVSMVTICDNPLCVRPDENHCRPMLLLPSGGRAWGLTGEDVRPIANAGRALNIPAGYIVGKPFEWEGRTYNLEPVVREYGYTKNPLKEEAKEGDTRPFAPPVLEGEDARKLEGFIRHLGPVQGEIAFEQWYQSTYRSPRGEWD